MDVADWFCLWMPQPPLVGEVSGSSFNLNLRSWFYETLLPRYYRTWLEAIFRLDFWPLDAHPWSDVISGFSFLVYQSAISSAYPRLPQEIVDASASRQADRACPTITLYRIADLVYTLYEYRLDPSDGKMALVSLAVAMIELADDVDEDGAARAIMARVHQLASNP
jgi:hypothetical protein